LRQRIADLDATIASLEHKVRDNVGGFLPFMVNKDTAKIIAAGHG
jgi:hypothetical protein